MISGDIPFLKYASRSVDFLMRMNKYQVRLSVDIKRTLILPICRRFESWFQAAFGVIWITSKTPIDSVEVVGDASTYW
jgi:hypothetical protein